MNNNFRIRAYYSFGASVKTEPGLFLNREKFLADSAKSLADALTREAEQIGSEGNLEDVKFSEKLEDFATKLDDIFKE